MSRPEFEPKQLAQTTWWEYLLRFGFGGLVAAIAAWIGNAHGPVVGGLFLAFPALLPSTLTLVDKHDGHAAACDDARGACVGSIGLAAFAAIVWAFSRAQAAASVTLTLALLGWGVVSYTLWWALLARR